MCERQPTVARAEFIRERRLVSQTFASWNHFGEFLRRLDAALVHESRAYRGSEAGASLDVLAGTTTLRR